MTLKETWMSGSISSMFTSPASPNKRRLGPIRQGFRQLRNQPSDALKFGIPLNLASWAARAWMWARESDNGLHFELGFLISLNHLRTASSNSGLREWFTSFFFDSKNTFSSKHFWTFSFFTLNLWIWDFETPRRVAINCSLFLSFKKSIALHFSLRDNNSEVF